MSDCMYSFVALVLKKSFSIMLYFDALLSYISQYRKIQRVRYNMLLKCTLSLCLLLYITAMFSSTYCTLRDQGFCSDKNYCKHIAKEHSPGCWWHWCMSVCWVKWFVSCQQQQKQFIDLLTHRHRGQKWFCL